MSVFLIVHSTGHTAQRGLTLIGGTPIHHHPAQLLLGKEHTCQIPAGHPHHHLQYNGVSGPVWGAGSGGWLQGLASFRPRLITEETLEILFELFHFKNHKPIKGISNSLTHPFPWHGTASQVNLKLSKNTDQHGPFWYAFHAILLFPKFPSLSPFLFPSFFLSFLSFCFMHSRVTRGRYLVAGGTPSSEEK